MKRFFKVFLLMLLVAAFVISIVACSPSSGYTGTYYEYDRNGNKTSDWIKLEKSKWSSSDGENGRLEVKDGAVTAYSEIFGEEEVFFTGTVSDGVLTYSMFEGIEYKAYKDGAYNSNPGKPSNPDTPSSDTFTVTFDSNGGSEVKSVSVHSDGTISAPENPTKAGYNFAGWYSDRNYSNKWSFSTKIRSDITLYAKWEKQIDKYTVTFESNGGSAVGSKQVNDGDKISAPVQPTKKMFVFGGWYKDSDFEEVWDFDTDVVTKNITLYAKWKEEEVRITSVNNATIEDNEITMVVGESIDEVDMNGKIILNHSEATWKLYYDRLGQMEIPTRIAANKNDNPLNSGSNVFYIVVTNKNGTQTKNYILDIYKKYEVKVMVFGLNGITPIDTFTAVTLETMPTPTATVTGYTVIGWESTSVIPGEILPKDAPLAITLTAKLKANTYKLTLDENGGTLENKECNATYDSSVTLPIPEKPGYTFVGWYYRDEKITNGKGETTWTIDRDISLTAKYRANVYSATAEKNMNEAGSVSARGNATSAVLSFDNNGRTGATEIDAQTVTTNFGMTPPTPPKADGYLFTGWFNEPECETIFDFSKNIYRDTTVYAGWYSTGISTKKSYLYEYGNEIQIATSDDFHYIYFAPVTSGTYRLYYKNSYTGSTYAARMSIYNVTERTSVKGETSVTNASYEYYSFTATAGNIYYACVSKYSSSSTFTCYLTPNSTNSVKGYFRTPDNVGAAGYQSEVTLTATTNSGYTWLGWFDCDTELTKELTYTFTMPAENKTFTAKWIKVSLAKNVTEAGSVSELTETYKLGDSVTLTATTNPGYTFIGWFDGNTELTKELTYTFTMSAENKTYTAKWIKVNTEANLSEAGSVSELTETYKPGDSATVTATTNQGYTFIGWFDGDTELTKELSYIFTMPAENKTFTAKWTYYTVSTETNMPEAGTYTEKTEEKTTVETEVTLTATTNIGYTWLGWFDGDTELTNELTYTFTMPAENKTYTAKWIKVNTETNLSEAGSVSELNETYKLGDSATVTATTNQGYTFIGWFDGDTELTKELSYIFTMPAENKTYTAKWTFYTISTETNMPEAGTYTRKNNKKTSAGTDVTMTATTNQGYTFIGWFDGDTELTKELTYTFTMPAENKTYTAKWEIKAEMENFYFTATENSVVITGVKNKTITEVIVPDYVTSIGYGAFNGCTNIETVTIPTLAIRYIPKDKLKTVVITSGGSIGSSAFQNCTGLTSITIPDSVTSIGSDAFSGCSGLTSITIPDSVTYIGSSAFQNCTGLTSVTIGSSVTYIDASAFRGCTNIETATIPTLAIGYIPKNKLKTVVITSGENIGFEAFSGCSGLTSITIPDSVTSIGSYAFYNCSGLTSITIPDSVTSIGSSAFYGCTGLTSIYYTGDIAGWCGISGLNNIMSSPRTLYIDGNKVEGELIIPEGVTSIGDYTFAWCHGLTSVTIPDSVTSIDDYAFYNCSGLTSVTIPDSVTSIGSSAFYNCSGLTSITIPDSVTSIGSSAFNGCSGLTSITIGNSVTSIGDWAFHNCGGLTSITIPDSVTNIGSGAFRDCIGLTSVTIGNSVTSIGSYAFCDCYKLVEVYNKSSLKITVGSYDYGYVGLYAKAVYTQKYTSKLSTDENGYIIYTDGKDKILIGYTGTETELTLPEGITEIYRYAFYKNTKITKVIIPDSVTNIGYQAFSGCSGLTSITIPDSVTSIGSYAFRGCSGLTSIIVNENNPNYKSIEGNLYSKYGKTLVQYAIGKTDSAFTIPDSVTSIDDYAFYNCSGLTSVTIPDSVTSIGNRAFQGCKNLTIYCKATSKPRGWDNGWNPDGCKVVWGAK